MSPTYRTIDARQKAKSLVKPGASLGLVEVTTHTLADRPIYNQLLETTLDAVEKLVTHVIARCDLRRSVEVEPIKTGHRVTHVELRWWRKDAGGEAEVERELQFSKVGRKERVTAKADAVRPRPGWLDAKGAALRSETYETAKLRFPGYDIYFVEGEWRAWAGGKPPAREPDKAYLAFFKTYVQNNPI